MKYLFIAITILILGCSNHNNKQKNEKQPQIEKKIEKKEENTINTVTLKDINITFKNHKIIYPSKKVVILFIDNSKYSKIQEKILKKLNVNYYVTDNNILKKEFNISIFPTIVVLDKNKTIKFENFTPIEFLKEEF